jgi:molybdopterin-guanine dinucleotide biosynthesis protein A
MTKRAALVLAGGKAYRFQKPQQNWQDKALLLLDNKPFLAHVVENVTAVVDEVIVCVNDEERKESYMEVLEKYNLNAKIVIDEKTEVGGPIRAILTGLKTSQADYCLIAPCDMPFISSKVVNYLFSVSKNFEVVMPMWPNGKLETLFMVLERSIGLEITQTLCQLERSHVDDIPRAATKTLLPSPLKNIASFDPQLKSFININCTEDLEKLQTRSIQGFVKEDTQFLQEKNFVSDLQVMREAAKMCQENNFMAAQEKFESCQKHFETYNNFFWAALACENKGNTLLKQLQLQKNVNQKTSLSHKVNVKEAFFNAVNNYANEAKIYDKKGCTQLLERTLTDKKRCKTLHTNHKKQLST